MPLLLLKFDLIWRLSLVFFCFFVLMCVEQNLYLYVDAEVAEAWLFIVQDFVVVLFVFGPSAKYAIDRFWFWVKVFEMYICLRHSLMVLMWPCVLDRRLKSN